MSASMQTAQETPTVLLIESSGQNCGVALWREGRIVSSFAHWIPNVHDRLLAELTRDVLKASALRVDDLSAIALSAGPGSFTGLRIGASFVKALCHDNQPPLIAVPTMSALARSAMSYLPDGCTDIVVLIAAQSGKLYVQRFDAQATALDVPQLINAASYNDFVSPTSFVCGPGAVQLGLLRAEHPMGRLHAEHLTSLALELYADGHFANAAEFVPLYVQDFVPKVQAQNPLS